MTFDRQNPGLDALDGVMIRAVQQGLPLVARPYAAIADELALTEAEVIARLSRLIETGTIKRLGVVVRHQELGYRANAMVVWALPEERVDELGRCIGRFPYVTLSYRRPPRLPDWPYNLFTMIHGRDREAVLSQIELIRHSCDLVGCDFDVLFSGRRFKQRGAYYGTPIGDLPKLSRDGPAPLGRLSLGGGIA